MAIEIFPDSPTVGMSPRISISHDLSQSDVVPVEQYVRSSSSSNIDFDFCVFRESFDQESSSADELFFDGKILPIEIKKRLAPPKREQQPPAAPPAAQLPPPPPPRKPNKFAGSINETKNMNSESEEKQKSFWRFKRSSSLNCGSGYGGTLCPLPLLSRNNSTGSSSSGKRSSLSNNQNQTFVKYEVPNSSSQRQQAQCGYWSKSPLKKNINSHFSYANGIKFNPVLNVPPANLFGLGSFFSGGKYRSKKKY